MASSGLTDLASFERSHVVQAALRAFAMTAILLVIYFVVPIESRPHQSPLLRLAVGLALFVAVLSNEIRLISRHGRPMLRAAVAMATIIPLFLIVFAWIYLTMARSDPGSFGQPLDRVSALYFTVTIFSTVGFGDITPKTDTARLVTTVQMLADLAVLAVVIRLIFAAAQHGPEEGEDESGEGVTETIDVR
jgi:voltage-gated potassium channel